MWSIAIHGDWGVRIHGYASSLPPCTKLSSVFLSLPPRAPEWVLCDLFGGEVHCDLFGSAAILGCGFVSAQTRVLCTLWSAVITFGSSGILGAPQRSTVILGEAGGASTGPHPLPALCRPYVVRFRATIA